MSEHPTRVVVIGGGYAGTLAVNGLRRGADVELTLVNPRPNFVQRIRLHQFVAGTADPSVDYDSLLGEGVRLVVDAATRIDVDARTVHLASGRTLDYDYLVYAVGSTGAPSPTVPGAAEFAYPVAEWEYARRLRDTLADLPMDAPVTVIGAGLTGIELSSELAARGRAVRLVCGGTLAPALSGRGRRSIGKRLARLGVEVLETAQVAEVLSDSVVFDDGAVVPSAVTIWTAGFAVPELATASGLRTDELGRLFTDETLTSIDDDRIVAAGDSAAPSGQPLRMSCQAAVPMGMQAANTVLSRIAGEEPVPLNQAFVGSAVSLGRRDAVIQVARRDDRPVNVVISGRMGAAIKEMVCKGTVKAIRHEAGKPGSTFWFKGGRRRPAPVPVAG